MVEPKVSLNLLVPGAKRLSSQECEKNPKDSYDEHKITLRYSKGKGKHHKFVKETIAIKTRKQSLISQVINICEEAYKSMIETPPTFNLTKIWPTMSKRERLKTHFDLIAHDLGAVSYDFEILGD